MSLRLLYIVAKKTAATFVYARTMSAGGLKLIFTLPRIPTRAIVDMICTRSSADAFGIAVIATLFKTRSADEDMK